MRFINFRFFTVKPIFSFFSNFRKFQGDSENRSATWNFEKKCFSSEKFWNGKKSENQKKIIKKKNSICFREILKIQKFKKFKIDFFLNFQKSKKKKKTQIWWFFPKIIFRNSKILHFYPEKLWFYIFKIKKNIYKLFFQIPKNPCVFPTTRS